MGTTCPCGLSGLFMFVGTLGTIRDIGDGDDSTIMGLLGTLGTGTTPSWDHWGHWGRGRLHHGTIGDIGDGDDSIMEKKEGSDSVVSGGFVSFVMLECLFLECTLLVRVCLLV